MNIGLDPCSLFGSELSFYLGVRIVVNDGHVRGGRIALNCRVILCSVKQQLCHGTSTNRRDQKMIESMILSLLTAKLATVCQGVRNRLLNL